MSENIKEFKKSITDEELAELPLAFFEGKQIRRIRDEVTEKWFFSVVDVTSALSQSSD